MADAADEPETDADATDEGPEDGTDVENTNDENKTE
jgi:hypothetical protein